MSEAFHSWGRGGGGGEKVVGEEEKKEKMGEEMVDACTRTSQKSHQGQNVLTSNVLFHVQRQVIGQPNVLVSSRS